MTAARVMLVEDEYVVARDLTNRLEKMGYRVCCHTSTGEKAVELALIEAPEIILMDIHLSGRMDGIQAAAEIHERMGVPVIFLTAYGDDEFLGRAKLTEPYGYVLKPLDDRDLRVNIEVALYRAKLEQERRRHAEERERLIDKLQQALVEVRTLRGFLPICSICKKIRDDEGYWQRIEKYIQDRADVLFSHSICPDCAQAHYPELFEDED